MENSLHDRACLSNYDSTAKSLIAAGARYSGQIAVEVPLLTSFVTYQGLADGRVLLMCSDRRSQAQIHGTT